MDKEEYKLKLQQINELADAGAFDRAAEVVDTIDWRHVKSVRTLCMVSEIYEAVKRNEDALRILKYAYRRSPSSKTVLYRLAEVSLKAGDPEAARDYTAQFKELSPNDTSGYVLEYKISRAEGYPVSDQIRILQKLKDHEYSEKWAYELARLYLKDGQEDKCVEECDDLILWFSEGRYVRKAMELKMEVRPLSPAQQAKYDGVKKVENHVKAAVSPEKTPEKAEEAIASVAESAEKTAEAQTEPAASPLPDRREAFEGASTEEVQTQLADSIRAVFSGIQDPDKVIPSDAEEAEEEFSEDDLHSYIRSRSETYASGNVRSLEPESIQQGALKDETAEVEEVHQMSLSDYDTAQQDKSVAELLSEMNSSFAKEIAEGDFAKTGEIHEEAVSTVHIPLFPEEETASPAMKAEEKTEEKAEEKAEEASPAQEKEAEETPSESQEVAFKEPVFTGAAATAAAAFADSLAELDQEEEEEPAPEDEGSLGLTREFNFGEELQKAMEGGASVREAAKEVSAKASQEAAEAIETEAPTPDETGELPSELFADTAEIRAEEVAQAQGFMAMDDVETGSMEPERSIIEDIMEAPETVEKLPIEGRPFTPEEARVFTYFAPIPGIAQQVTEAMADIHNNAGDKTSRSGNIIMMGRQGAGKTRLADAIILSVCADLNIEGAKIAHIVADDLNKKNPAEIVSRMAGGFLVIEGAGALSEASVNGLSRAMEFRTDDLVVILEDEKKDLLPLLDKYPNFAAKFSSRVTIPVFTNDELVTFGKTYTKERGYKMDEMCVLALYTMIGDNQKDREPVTVGKVQTMIDTAISRAEKGTRRLGRKLSRKETDRDGRIILHEKDFDF